MQLQSQPTQPSNETGKLETHVPVGGTDPDFVLKLSAAPRICAIPVLGRFLPQCK